MVQRVTDPLVTKYIEGISFPRKGQYFSVQHATIPVADIAILDEKYGLAYDVAETYFDVKDKIFVVIHEDASRVMATQVYPGIHTHAKLFLRQEWEFDDMTAFMEVLNSTPKE